MEKDPVGISGVVTRVACLLTYDDAVEESMISTNIVTHQSTIHIQIQIAGR